MMDHGTFILCTNVHGKISVQTDQSCWRHLYGVETLLGAAGFPVGDFMNWRRRLCPDISRHFPTIPDFSRWWDLAGNVGASSGGGSIWGEPPQTPVGRVDLFHPKLLHRQFTFLFTFGENFSPNGPKYNIWPVPPRNFPNRNCIPL